MPQPVHHVVPNPNLYFDPNVLADKADMALLVARIFALWGRIEHELSMLLSRILGAESAPAIAMHSVLTNHLQMLTLEAAAKEALPVEDFEILKASLRTTKHARTPRNRLAHWLWGGCKERPDLLILFDPIKLKTRHIQSAKYFHEQEQRGEQINSLHVWNLLQYQSGEVLAYDRDDLERAASDLREASETIYELERFLKPETTLSLVQAFQPDATAEYVRSLALRSLNDKRLFREGLKQIRKDQDDGPN